jgi:hypothetical protein
MTDDTTPRQPYQWVTNLYMPFDLTDFAWLEKLGDYKIGAPAVAKDRETALTPQELADFNIVGIYTTEEAYRRANPDKITQAMARRVLGAEHTPLLGHLAKYLDGNCRYVGSQ